MNPPLITDELDLLESLVPLQGSRLLEAGCGAAQLARDLLRRHDQADMVCLEVDEKQLAKNRANPMARLHFEQAGAQEIPFAQASFDGALMLKSLHHVPVPSMDKALEEMARVLRPGGWLYVSEPVYAGPLNDIVRLFNDEKVVRAEAQAALDRAVASGRWITVRDMHFETKLRFASFEEFEQKVMRPSFADHHIDAAMVTLVRERFEPHLRPDGAHFQRAMHVRLLRTAV
jgi:ubiquinone/menaquinone biosynthesis C-methylase UbiE